jgi:hypothetical protein
MDDALVDNKQHLVSEPSTRVHATNSTRITICRIGSLGAALPCFAMVTGGLRPRMYGKSEERNDWIEHETDDGLRRK